MSFLRRRHEQLTDHLREEIRAGRLAEPLPGAREWASRLGVSCTTLYAALHTLEREGLVAIHARRGVRILSDRAKRADLSVTKVVRVIFRGLDYPQLNPSSLWVGQLTQRLQTHGIQVVAERCTDSRLRHLGRPRAHSSSHTNELLLLGSLSEANQRMFARSGRPALVVGYPAPGVTLPYVTADLEGSIRHATHALFRAGHSHVILLVNRVRIHALERQSRAFRNACADWRPGTVRGEVVLVPPTPDHQLGFLHRFAGRVRSRCGILVVSPVSLAAVMTTLLGRGVRIPGQAAIAWIETVPIPSLVWPPPIHYAVSPDAFVRVLTRAAVYFFKTGEVPAMRKTLPIERVPRP